MSDSTKIKSESEWKSCLTPDQVHLIFFEIRHLIIFAQFRILRQKGMERAGSGTYDKHKEKGAYFCVGCNSALYSSSSKFQHGYGWPSFRVGEFRHLWTAK
jgi:peptide-methionine (R)-S-oxide reductase